MTKSLVIELKVVEVVEYEFHDVHYESPLGTRVTQVNVDDIVYIVGAFRDKTTQVGVSGVEVFAYQTDVDGVPITPYNYIKDTTLADGIFNRGSFTAVEAGNIWFVVYDKLQAEAVGLPTT